VTEYDAIFENLDRCIGCYACEVACRKQNDLPENQSWIRIHEIGPDMIDDRLSMEFIVSITDHCTLCTPRLKDGLKPFCVSVCPTKALIYCKSTAEILRQIRQKGMQVIRLDKMQEKLSPV
jgi:Fe-S-cluster-containing dehydrogenase component